jgi:mRNA interferase RelE/StbE
MIVRVDKSFQKDTDKITDAKLKRSISEVVQEVQKAENLLSIKNLKKLTGYKEFYRIKMGDYRIG